MKPRLFFGRSKRALDQDFDSSAACLSPHPKEKDASFDLESRTAPYVDERQPLGRATHATDHPTWGELKNKLLLLCGSSILAECGNHERTARTSSAAHDSLRSKTPRPVLLRRSRRRTYVVASFNMGVHLIGAVRLA